MAITAYEGVVEKGAIRLKSGVRLPENVKVYVIVPDQQTVQKKITRILSPRLVHRQQISDFEMKVFEMKVSEE
jgi:hypothetical protein